MKTQHDNVCEHIELYLTHSECAISVTQLCSNSAAPVFWLTGSAGLSPPPPLTPKELGRWGRSSRNVGGGGGQWGWCPWRVQISLLPWASPSAQ